MNTYLVVDKLLRGATLEWLETSSGFERRSDRDGVAVFAGEHGTAVVVDPDGFSMAYLSNVLRNSTRLARNLDIIAPSVIQYFASQMTSKDPIFEGINTLSGFPIVVAHAPSFRMLHRPDGDAVSLYKHEITAGSYPESFKLTTCHYVGPDGGLLDLHEIGLRPDVTPVAVPMVFYHSGLALQTFDKQNLIVSPDLENRYGYERMAFNELMIRFPSRDEPYPEELDRLIDHTKLDRKTIVEIWNHNRAQWNKVRADMKTVGMPVPGPTQNNKAEAFHQFTSLIMAGTNKLVSRLDVPVDTVRHIGIPVLARNGVTIPLGESGIVKKDEVFAIETMLDRIKRLLPRVLSVKPTTVAKSARLRLVEPV